MYWSILDIIMIIKIIGKQKNPESIFRNDPDLDSKSTGNFDS